MKKLILFILVFVFFSFHTYSQDVYFTEPDYGDIYYMGSNGQVSFQSEIFDPINSIYYHVYPNGFYTKLSYPDGSESGWVNSRTVYWRVFMPGTYVLNGKTDGYIIGGADHHWEYCQQTFSVVDNNAPGAPQNLQVINNGGSPGLTWSANSEYDIAGYNIYRRESYNWENIGFTSNTSYVDYGVEIHTMSLDQIEYKITAVDNGSLESGFSATVSIIGTLK